MKVLLLLVQNLDVFAWSPYEVPGVDLELKTHQLNVGPSYPPKNQKLRRSAREHIEAVKQEVKEVERSGAIKEFFFLEWVANTVVVKKENGKWRVCVDLPT